MNDKFSWTQEYRRSWEENSRNTSNKANSNIRIYNTNRKNIIRHFFVAIDTSFSIEKQDYVPTIRSVVANALPKFVENFKSANPLSILSFLTCKNVFEKYSKEFDANKLLNLVGSESFSLLNCLKSGVEFLKTDSYSKEMLIITASISSKDTGPYDQILQDIKRNHIKISFISICGEVTLFKNIAKFTNGQFYVPLNAFDLESIFFRFTAPLESYDSTISLVKLGFPKITNENGLCHCHLKYNFELYECPVCKACVCELPSQCRICETQLVTPMSIAKSYYFLYQLKSFLPCEQGFCVKCSKPSKTQCGDCKNTFCFDCSEAMQNLLSFCLFCEK